MGRLPVKSHSSFIRTLSLIGISGFTVAFILNCGSQSRQKQSSLHGLYLGQESPGEEPRLFMPGLVSTSDLDGCVTFLQNGTVCVFSRGERGTHYMYMDSNGRWTAPQIAPFQNQQGMTDFTSVPGGKALIFQSSRPTHPGDTQRDTNAWKVEWTGSGWAEAEILPSPPNSDEYSESYPSITSDGILYFFTSSRPDSFMGDVYRRRFLGGEYLEVERMEEPINSEYHDVDPYIAPDESYLVYGSGRPGGYGIIDTYICFRREDGSWAFPVNAGKKLNSYYYAIRIGVTPDGRYFFFSGDNRTEIPKGEIIESPFAEAYGNSDVYWVETGFIDDLKKLVLNNKSAGTVIKNEYLTQGLLSAITKLQKIYSSEQDHFHFEPSEMIAICEHMLKSGNKSEAEQFYLVLLELVEEDFRIRKGYAEICVMTGQIDKGLALIQELWADFSAFKSFQYLPSLSFDLTEHKKINAAFKVLHFNIREFPDSYQALFSLAEAYENRGDKQKALGYCRRALELKPDFDFAQNMLKRLEKE